MASVNNLFVIIKEKIIHSFICSFRKCLPTPCEAGRRTQEENRHTCGAYLEPLLTTPVGKLKKNKAFHHSFSWHLLSAWHLPDHLGVAPRST